MAWGQEKKKNHKKFWRKEKGCYLCRPVRKEGWPREAGGRKSGETNRHDGRHFGFTRLPVFYGEFIDILEHKIRIGKNKNKKEARCTNFVDF